MKFDDDDDFVKLQMLSKDIKAPEKTRNRNRNLI